LAGLHGLVIVGKFRHLGLRILRKEWTVLLFGGGHFPLVLTDLTPAQKALIVAQPGVEDEIAQREEDEQHKHPYPPLGRGLSSSSMPSTSCPMLLFSTLSED